MRERPVAWTLVTLQFGFIAGALLSGPTLSSHPALLALQGLGLVIGLWALTTMGLRIFSVTPIPKSGSRLVASGPYRWIRHPMYTAVLLFTLGPPLSDPGAIGVTMWVLLLATLLVKLHFEERLLAERLPGYETYRSETDRLVPFVY